MARYIAGPYCFKEASISDIIILMNTTYKILSGLFLILLTSSSHLYAGEIDLSPYDIDPAMKGYADWLYIRPLSESVEEELRIMSDAGKLDAVTFLLVVLRKGTDEEVSNACLVAGEIKDPILVETLIQILLDRNIWGFSRGYAALSLGKIGDKRAIKPLQEVILSEAVIVEEGEGVDPLSYSSSALNNIGDKTAFEPVYDAFKGDDLLKRRNAAIAMGDFEDQRAESLLVNGYTKEKDVEIKRRILRSLAQKKSRNSTQVLISALSDIDEDEWVRITAGYVLGEKKDPVATDALVTALKDKNDYVVQVAIEALGQLGDPSAIQPLLEFCRNSDKKEYYCPDIYVALRHITGNWDKNISSLEDWNTWWAEHKQEYTSSPSIAK